MSAPTEDAIIARVRGLRPRWWWLFPRTYVRVLEDYMRELIMELEQTRAELSTERDAIVQYHYQSAPRGRPS